VPDAETVGRPNQRRRTRKDLLQAAARLMKQGRKPNLEDIAAEALVSRATAYRYFPSVEALLVEAALDVAFPAADEVFGKDAPADPVARLLAADAAVQAMMATNEAPLRMMLANTLQQVARGEAGGDMPARQNRRSPLIAAALEPVRDQFDPKALDRLGKALALVFGVEALIVFKDVLQLDDAEAEAVRGWAIEALVAAAKA
jgi:AcrR family transcriptional regulator